MAMMACYPYEHNILQCHQMSVIKSIPKTVHMVSHVSKWKVRQYAKVKVGQC